MRVLPSSLSLWEGFAAAGRGEGAFSLPLWEGFAAAGWGEGAFSLSLWERAGERVPSPLSLWERAGVRVPFAHRKTTLKHSTI